MKIYAYQAKLSFNEPYRVKKTLLLGNWDIVGSMCEVLTLLKGQVKKLDGYLNFDVFIMLLSFGLAVQLALRLKLRV